MFKDLPKSLIETAKALKIDTKSNTHSSNLRKREKEIAASHDANVKEEAEQIDELSKKTLGSYVKKSADDLAFKAYDAGSASDRDKGKTNYSKAVQRLRGIKKASDKLTKEEVEIDEALVGNQHKIDADKDGKIEKSDFAKLRKGKMKEGYVSDAQRKAVWAARDDEKKKKKTNEEVHFSDEELARIQEIIGTDK